MPRLCGLGIVLLLAGLRASANTNTAASASFADVSAAVASSAPGDIVIIPPGTGNWTSPLTLQDVSLIGSGTNLTVIIDNMDRNANPNPPLIFMHGVTTNVMQVGNFQLVGGNQTLNWHGEIASDFSGPSRLHDIFYNLCSDKDIILYGANQILIDHCYFLMKFSGINIQDVGYGDASWATSPNYGTALVPVIEDCTFTNTIHNSASDNTVDCAFGGRATFRHNLVYYSFFEAHGSESGGRNRGGRVFEVYSNVFVQDPQLYFPCAVNLRAGSGVFYGNTATGYSYFANINVNRTTECFNPWGRGDGTSPWDDNGAANLLSGVHSGPSGVNYLQVAGANWTVNQWVGKSVVNLNWNGNISGMPANWATNYNYSVIISNNANQIFYHISKDYGYMYFTNGDHFVINTANHILDQPGMGSGDLIRGDAPPYGPGVINTTTGGPAWPHEQIEGIYSWNNTLNGQDAGFGSDFPQVQVGRELLNDTPKPGYTPLVYPHPLQSGSSYISPGGSGASLQPPARVWVQQ